MSARRSLRFEWSLVAVLALAWGVPAVAAETSAAPASTPAKASAPAKTSATAAKPPAAKAARRSTTAGAQTKSRSSATAAAKSAAPKDGAPRRLTDVHIEGEMPVPQVLFITARDQRRYVDFQHQRYLRDSRALGAATATPTRVTAAGDDTPH